MKGLKIIFQIILSFLFISGVKAQKLDSIMTSYSEQYQEEKVHIQFDKPFYKTGDVIWYKAYLVMGNEPSNLSSNFYVDWFDDDGRLLKHTVNPIEEASSKGEFEIPSSYKGRSIFIKAYTRRMLNFDTDFVFQKLITVAQKSSISKSFDINEAKIQFFPEGGDLIAGVPARIAFKAIYGNGLPVNVKGIILKQNGEVVDSFSSEHDGMGSFMLAPSNNEIYTARWIDLSYQASYTTQLPGIKGNGINLQINPLPERDIVKIKRSAIASEDLKTLHLLAHMNHYPVFSASINLQTKDSILLDIPTASLPSGILQVTIFNDKWVPVAERVVFVNNHEYSFNTNINTLAKGLGKREKNVFEISTKDNTAFNLSVSVTDAELSAGEKFENNIFTQLLICSDLKGFIYQPAYYFSGDEDTIDHHLDLVMLTHGWRRYKWDEITKGILPNLPFSKDTGTLIIEGQVKNISKFKIPKGGQQISLIIQSSDSSQQIFSNKLSENGKFTQSINSFFDSSKLYYQFVNHQQLNDKADITFTTNWLSKPANSLFEKFNYGSIKVIEHSALKRDLFLFEEENKIEKDKVVHRLSDVTVKAKIKKQEELLDQQYTSGMYRGGDAIKLDVLADPKNYPGITLAQYLSNKIAGLRVMYDSIGNPVYSWRGDRTDIFLDEVVVSQDSMSMGTKNIDMTNIAYIKIFRPGSSVGSANASHLGGSPGGAIALYSKKAENLNLSLSTFKLAKLEGYTPYKEFYSPDYSETPKDFFKDARTTLYWDPMILSKVSGNKIKIEFFNNDYSKKYRIVIEGINADGRMTRIEKVIE